MMEHDAKANIEWILRRVEMRAASNEHEHAATILRDALALMRELGWTKGVFSNPQGFCAVGALRAVSKSMTIMDAINVVQDVIEEQYGRISLTYWNDTDGRTFSEVEAVFEKAIMRLEEKVD